MSDVLAKWVLINIYQIKNELPKGRYNQIANYVMMQSEINITLKDRSPRYIFLKLYTTAKKEFLNMGQL